MRRPLSSKAFTLIEVVIAIAILSLIVGGVMASVMACLQATQVVRSERLFQGRCDVLQSLLSHSLMTLPGDALLRCSMTDTLSGEPAPLRLLSRQPVMIASSLASQPGRTCESEILFRRESDGSFTLGSALAGNGSPGFLPAETLTSPSLAWTPLVRNIREAKWKFYDHDQARWIERWEKEESRPTLVELDISFSESAIPYRGVFWIPVQPAKGTRGPTDGGENTPTHPEPSPTP